MTTEKDAMALAVLDRADEMLFDCPSTRKHLREARAHLAERLYLMGGEVARFKEVADSLSEQMVRMEDCITHERDRATRAEAELAAAKERIARILQTNAARRGMGPWPDAARGGE